MTDDEKDACSRAEEVRKFEEKLAIQRQGLEAQVRHLEARVAEARRRGDTDTDAYRQGLQSLEMARRVLAGEKFDHDIIKAWAEAIFNPNPRH